MSFTPGQVGRMSLYEFSACVDGFNKANSPEGGKPAAPSDAEYAAALAAHDDL